MKRLHVHIRVNDLARSVAFYENLFGAPPSLRHADYAKWSLEDPRVNFAISHRDGPAGLDHLGIQVDDAGALAEISDRLAASGAPTVAEADTACCYARSDKTWAKDPQGISWETFVTHAQLPAGTGDGEMASCCGDSPCGGSPKAAPRQRVACCV